jgi:hypothetical protein
MSVKVLKITPSSTEIVKKLKEWKQKEAAWVFSFLNKFTFNGFLNFQAVRNDAGLFELSPEVITACRASVGVKGFSR